MDATFFTVSDERFFVGTVCTVNSLRLTGHDQEIVVLDLGLSSDQRRRLEQAATVVDPPGTHSGTVFAYKPFPFLLGATGTIVLIDSDMIVTRSLEPVIEDAAAGRVVMFSDLPAMSGRWFAEWEELFNLHTPPRREEYMNAGFVAMSIDHFPDFLERWWHASVLVPPERTLGKGARGTDPFCFSDQDALNALLMSEVPAGTVARLPHEEAPSEGFLASVEVVDEASLACRLGAHSPYVLHYWGGPKPWEPVAWMRVRRNAYVKLMPRLLFAPDAPVPVAPEELPRWLRPGRLERAQLNALSAANGALRFALDRLSPDTRRKAAMLRKRLVG
ncbi:MAG: hypothetical protein QOE77_4175 [Blastocatellia bacterium]|nr:hypothetical protein [Blastocatellia bacterium]